MKWIFEKWGEIPEAVRGQARLMAWVLFGFLLAIQAISFYRTGEFYLFELRKVFGL